MNLRPSERCMFHKAQIFSYKVKYRNLSVDGPILLHMYICFLLVVTYSTSYFNSCFHELHALKCDNVCLKYD